MAITIFGNNLSLLVEQPQSGAYNLTAEGIFTITRIWRATYDVCVANAPGVRSIDPYGTNALCIQVDITRESPNLGTVTAVYQGFLNLPFTIYELSNSRMERPIGMHPKFLDTSVFPESCKVFEIPDAVAAIPIFVKFKDVGTDGDPDLKFRGIESFIVGNVQWRKTSYSQTPDFSATDVGKLSAPETGSFTGLPDQSNSGKKWLKIEKNCRNIYKGASLLWEINEVWQYNELGWTTEIYS